MINIIAKEIINVVYTQQNKITQKDINKVICSCYNKYGDVSTTAATKLDNMGCVHSLLQTDQTTPSSCDRQYQS